ncbi:MAG: YadA C-terminal domain-containing protein [Thermodesulfobacteriota bacterium]|nr:YadA C-terminal domain-containing protein [Thermodesulfobacteriota bacterium]
MTNGLDNTHGIVVTETQTTMSGGTQSSSLTLNNNGATFSNAADGNPVQVHGVADGTSDFDAVNFRQLEKAYAGVASIAALAAIPAPAVGNRFSIGMGYGNFERMNAVAIGAKAAITKNITMTGGVGFCRDNTTVSAGVGWSF